MVAIGTVAWLAWLAFLGAEMWLGFCFLDFPQMASIHDTPSFHMPGIHRIPEMFPEEEEMQIRRNLKLRDTLISKKLDLLEKAAKAAGRPFKR
ncbi:hypothetical protein C5167_045194 [Papaver somniferum]|uniref:Uncharacterized protein n=1 Tax=Papaver somniferum TaxID=3469 RepID=A0A4Y7LA65_PAPSO|nr:hypothetical protein C5167_045194 [Papaver somniferum]